MKKLDTEKAFAQYRGSMYPYEPVTGRKYTVTHSDTTAEMFVFISDKYADDQVTDMRDEVRLKWENSYERPFTQKACMGMWNNTCGYILKGSVLVSNNKTTGDPAVRNRIFYTEMPIALQALRQADRFLFEKHTFLDKAHVVIRFVSDIQEYDKTYDFGCIGDFRAS